MSQNIFTNPYVFQVPFLSGSPVGNGTLTIDRLTHFTVDQQYTAICSAISPFTVFNIIGSLDGIIGVAVVGNQFTDEDNKVFLTIQQGPTLFQIGDTFEFEVKQGTDLNQQNLDSYDELPQKNFGVGLTGQNKGDHNIRFSALPVKAFKNIGDLKFTAKDFGNDGNEISIEYIEGSLLTPAVLTIGDLTFEANDAGAGGNDISMEYISGTPGSQAGAIIQDIEYEADDIGIAGNLISIEYTGGATAGSEIVTVIGSTITVQIEDGVSTSDDIELALALNTPASLLINTIALGLTGLEPQYIHPQTFLTGGVDPIGQVVTVIGNAISVQFEDGVSTALDIQASLDASPAALSLITTTVTGTGLTIQSTPVPPTFLSGGSEDVGIPGFEIVQVVGKEIKVSFVNSLSTAQQIKTAIEANLAANALVDISFLLIGTEFQSSPIARTFLTGGRLSGSYAFNTAELTDSGNFFEGNAPIIHNGSVNQGDELTLGETIKKGKVTLDDDILSNNPGPLVEHAQQTINNLIQNGKAFLVTADNSKVIWEKPLLNFAADIIFCFPDTGFFNTILVAQSPISILDGEHAYVVVDRLASADLTVIIDTTIPTGENVFRLFSRRGDDLIWYDNTLQREKKKIRIGEGGGGGTAYQEKIGVGNGAGLSFPLTFIPSNETSILVICSYVRSVVSDYNYNPIGNVIEFTTAPAAGQDVYVFYLTDGETLSLPSPIGLLNSYIHTVTLAEETAKELTLANTPFAPSKVLVDILGGGVAEFNYDFNISVDKFQWSGFALDGLLAENDKIRFYFYS